MSDNDTLWSNYSKQWNAFLKYLEVLNTAIGHFRNFPSVPVPQAASLRRKARNVVTAYERLYAELLGQPMDHARVRQHGMALLKLLNNWNVEKYRSATEYFMNEDVKKFKATIEDMLNVVLAMHRPEN